MLEGLLGEAGLGREEWEFTNLPEKCHCALLLGQESLTRFHPVVGAKLGNWRGSVWLTSYGTKCVASHHPDDIHKQPDWMPLLRFDVERAVEEAGWPELRVPERVLLWPRCGLLESVSTR